MQTISEQPTLYLMCANVTSDYQWFIEWMRRRHCPDVMALGYWSASAYRARTGRQNLWDIYEIPDIDVFETPEYQQVSLNDPDTPRVMSLFTHRSVSLYDQISIVDRHSYTSTSPFRSRVISAMRFDATEADVERFVARQETLIKDIDGLTGARLCRLSERQHPKWPSTEPEYLLCLDWNDEKTADSLDEEALRHIMPFAREADYSQLTRVYGIHRDDVWD